MALSAGKIAQVYFESVLESYEHQMQMMDLVDVFRPNDGDMQNAGNFVWRPVQQHAPIIAGFDISGLETDIIEETYPAVLGTPQNDFFEQRVDNLRDMNFWERRGKQSGKRQATELNSQLAQLVADTGSLFYTSNTTSGFEFVAEAQALMNERQVSSDDRVFVLNDRDMLKFSPDLAGRQTLQGRPADTWASGQIGSNIAEFDIYTGSYLPVLTGGSDPATTVTSGQSFAPTGGSVSATGVVTNVDYREATIPVTASGSYSIGDRVTFANSAVTVKAVGLADKNDTGIAMTFTIVAIPSGTSVTVFPKPIAADDSALSTLEKAYANVDTTIENAATMNRLNTAASSKTNIFWAKDSIEIVGGNAPLNLLAEFDGMKVIQETLKSGQTLYMAYDGDLAKLTFRCRLFTWYGLTNKNPMANGVALTIA